MREQRNNVDIQLARQRLHRQNLVERMSAEYSLQPADVLKAQEPEWEEGTPPTDREVDVDALLRILRGLETLR